MDLQTLKTSGHAYWLVSVISKTYHSK
jgi:hypothetical protein